MVKDTSSSLFWTNERHGEIMFALHGSRSANLFIDAFELLLKTRDYNTFWRILYSGRFGNDEIKAVLAVLRRVASFFYHELSLDGIYMQDGTSPKLHTDYCDHLTTLHCLLVALLSKVISFPTLRNRIRRHLWNVLNEKMLLPSNYLFVEYSTIYDLLLICIQQDLLRDTFTLDKWATEWVDSKFLTRCLSRYPCLINDDSIFLLHPKSAQIYDSLWITVINEFLHNTDVYRPGAQSDSVLIHDASKRSRDGDTLNFNDLSKEELLRVLNLEATKETLQHPRRITLTLSSHGDGPALLCNDGETIDYVDLIDTIIENAPKLETLYIIIQACQGSCLRKIDKDESVDISFVNWQENLNLKPICREGIEIYCLRSSIPSHLSVSTKHGSLIYLFMKQLMLQSPNFTKGWIPVDRLLRATADQFKDVKVVCGKEGEEEYLIRPVLEYYSPQSIMSQ